MLLISCVALGTFGCRSQPWRRKHIAYVMPALGDTLHQIPSSVSNNSSSMKLTSLHYYLNHVVSSQPPLSSVTPPSMTAPPMTLTTMSLLTPQRLDHMMNSSMMTGNKVVFDLHYENVVCDNYISHVRISKELIADLLSDLFCHEIPTIPYCWNITQNWHMYVIIRNTNHV